MKKQYQKPKLLRYDYNGYNFVIMSGDGYVEDPWAEGFGGEL